MISGPAPTTGSFTANAQTVSINAAQFDRVAIQLVGSPTMTVQFEGTIDGTNWFSVAPVPVTATARTTGVVSATAAGLWEVDAVSLVAVRCRVSAFTSGTFAVTMLGARIGN